MDRTETTAATATKQNLEDFPEFLHARNTLDQLRAKLAETDVRRGEAEARHFSAMQTVQAAPPPYLAREVEALEAEMREQQTHIRDAEQLLQRVTAECRARICRTLAPEHRRLKVRIKARASELLDAVRAERAFRQDLDRRGVLVTGDSIKPVALPGISTPDEIEGLEIALKTLEQEDL